MKTTILTAGAAGMFCGSCMRDNTLAAALMASGRDVELLPMYTPLRTDERNVSRERIFFGGINVFLQQAAGLFRRTPRALDWLWDRPGLLRLLGKLGSSTDPRDLGPLTVSVLAGREGNQVKELNRLVVYLRDHSRPDVVTLPNAMMLGLAEPIRKALDVPVLCELTGEDVFLDELPQPYRQQAMDWIGVHSRQVNRFLAASGYYADKAAAYFGLDRSRIDVLPPGIHAADLAPAGSALAEDRAPTVGYLSRFYPEKGFDQAVRVMLALRRKAGFENARLVAGGYVAPTHKTWLHDQLRIARTDDQGRWLDFRGELTRHDKARLLQQVDLLCVPTPYPEPKGLYLFEALAAGVPFAGYDHGAFGEWIAATGGGVLAPAGDVDALAERVAEVLADRAGRIAMGRQGRAAVLEDFTAERLAERFVRCLDRLESSA